MSRVVALKCCIYFVEVLGWFSACCASPNFVTLCDLELPTFGVQSKATVTLYVYAVGI